MKLDEAIKHAEEVAVEHTKYNRYGGFESCDECAKEHRQLANWLKELKQLREQEPCEDAISRKALIERINNAEENFKVDNMDSISSGEENPFVDGVLSGVFNIRQMVAQAPSCEPARKKGKWINKSQKSGCGITFVASECTCCGKKTLFNCDELLYKYCPNCGAEMESEEDGND